MKGTNMYIPLWCLVLVLLLIPGMLDFVFACLLMGACVALPVGVIATLFCFGMYCSGGM